MNSMPTLYLVTQLHRLSHKRNRVARRLAEVIEEEIIRRATAAASALGLNIC